MTGSSPTPPRPKLTRQTKRRRAGQPMMPWNLIAALFGIYLGIGLLLSLPAPPYWVWIPAILGTLLLIFGLNRPASASAKRFDPVGILTYIGGLLLVIALAVGANYIGGESLDGVSFGVAVFGLIGFTLLAVLLTAAAALVSALTGERLMQSMDYGRRLSIIVSTCIFGLGLGALIGFSTLVLATTA